MRRRARVAAACLALAALAGCTVAPVRAPLPPAQRGAALEAQAARESWLAAHPDWRLEGRVALSNGSRGGSGRLEWEQQAGRYAMALSAPITRQGWRLSGDAGGAVLEGLDGGPRTGPDASRLLRDATGWEIPVAALAAWVRGGRADRAPAGAAPAGAAPADAMAALEFSADGRLSRLRQDGWTLDYADWRPQPAGIELPMRVTATRDDARVRLVVDVWGGTGP